MRAPVGSRGRYFRLVAIAVLRDTVRQAAQAVRRRQRHSERQEREYGEQEVDPPPSDLTDLYTVVTVQLSRKACHCNCFFKRRFRRLWHLYKFFFTPPGRYFKMKTGTSPPLSFSFIILT